MLERTVVIVKPDGMIRGLAGRVITMLEDRGLAMTGCRLLSLDDELLRDHYSHLIGRPFFDDLVVFMKSTAVLAMCWTGRNAVAVVRATVGPTDAAEAPSGTIRGTLSTSHQFNVVHASESVEAAEIEVRRFFRDAELVAAPESRLAMCLAVDERMP